MILRDRIALAWLMKSKHITQRQLAEAAGWKSHGHVGNLLRGTKKTVTPESAFRIAQRLGVRPDDLFVPRVSTKPVERVRSKSVA
jgi:transcriptional regulator with XRE-family HTH domain